MAFDATQGNDLALKGLSGTAPFMASRIGSIELNCILNFIQGHTWSPELRQQVFNNTGFFPVDDDSLKLFSTEFLNHLKNTDVLAVWRNEDALFNWGYTTATPVHLRSVEPYYHRNPWSQILKGKKVLVIHPSEDSIKSQYKKRALLFKDPEVLPEFELKTIKAILSHAGNITPYKTWFEAYNYLCDQIVKADFDIAIIGAGSYGLPLASFIKQQGKKAVHMGGATQILFGIKGKRWDDHEEISKLYNEHWVRPAPHEIPANYLSVENGCYW